MIKIPRTIFWLGVLAGMLLYAMQLIPQPVRQAHELFGWAAMLVGIVTLGAVVVTTLFESE